MKKFKRACKKAYEMANNDQGIAMIVAVVVGAVIMAFCLALLLVTYSLFAQTSRKTTQIRCKLMAQSYSEVLGVEFNKKPEESELQQYLSDKVKDQTWKASFVSYDDTDEGGKASLAPDQILELSIANDTNVAAGYILTTTFTYEENSNSDDEDIVEGNNKDDQFEEEDEGAGTEPDAGAGAGTNPGIDPGTGDDISYAGEYIVNAEIKCIRGDGGGKDVQTYTINRQFRLTVKEDTE